MSQDSESKRSTTRSMTVANCNREGPLVVEERSIHREDFLLPPRDPPSTQRNDLQSTSSDLLCEEFGLYGSQPSKEPAQVCAPTQTAELTSDSDGEEGPPRAPQEEEKENAIAITRGYSRRVLATNQPEREPLHVVQRQRSPSPHQRCTHGQRGRPPYKTRGVARQERPREPIVIPDGSSPRADVSVDLINCVNNLVQEVQTVRQQMQQEVATMRETLRNESREMQTLRERDAQTPVNRDVVNHSGTLHQPKVDPLLAPDQEDMNWHQLTIRQATTVNGATAVIPVNTARTRGEGCGRPNIVEPTLMTTHR